MNKTRYQGFYEHRKTPSVYYKYHCAQNKKRQHKIKKKAEETHQRDKVQMDTFTCRGWLFITLVDGDLVAWIKYRHEDDHVPYWKTDVPTEIQQYVKDHLEMTPTQVR